MLTESLALCTALLEYTIMKVDVKAPLFDGYSCPLASLLEGIPWIKDWTGSLAVEGRVQLG